MKKNKKLQYILLVLVVLIWGSITYQLINFTGDNHERNYADFISSKQINLTEELRKDSFSIQVNYPDPFLSEVRLNRKLLPKSSREKRLFTKTNKKNKPKIPLIKYKGYSVNQNHISRGKMEVEGVPIIIKIGEEKKGIKLLKLTRDSAVIMTLGKHNTIYRN